MKFSNVLIFLCILHIVMHKNNRVLKNCDKNTYTLLMNTAAELGDFKRVTSRVLWSVIMNRSSSFLIW